MKVLWFFGTVIIVIVAVTGALYLLAQRRPKYSVALILMAVIATLANPLINMFVFSHQAERCREKMLASAKAENCMGQSTDWLRSHFGNPYQIFHDGKIDRWWYTPGPWYILAQEDYVGFAVENGRITGAYMQIN